MRYSLDAFKQIVRFINSRLTRRASLSLLAVFLLSASALATYYVVSPPREVAVSSGIVISQLYGGGGNAGATYTNDFIELFNRGNTTVNVTGWSVQYASATGTTWQVTNLSGSIPAGGYYLVQEAQGAGGTTSLPTPDATGTIAMSGTAGKVALVNVTTALTGACPTGASIIDFVGYGATANCFEGAAATPAPSNTTAVLRGANGCTETDTNSTDFTAGTPNPRNSASPLNPCGGGGNPPVVPTCPASLSTPVGTATSGNVSATDSNGTVTSASITSITPGNPGTITLNSFTPAGAAGGMATAVLNVGNTTPAGAYTVVITWSNNDAPTPQTATCTVAVTVMAAGNTLIHDIQGTTETPNFAGMSVTIQGIVVGDFQTSSGLSGFFVEEEDADQDANPNTSEGIFVFDGAAPAVNVNVGDKVTVTGTVLNLGGPPGLTELSPATSVVVNSTGNPLPTAVTVVLPVAISPAADLEKYEGMRVQFSQPLFVTEDGALGTFGELSLSATAPLYIPTNSVDPNDNPATGNTTTGNSNVPAVTAQQTANNNSRIILDDGRGGSNLSPIAFIGAGTNATIRRGDSVSNLAGILSFGFSNYRIEPTATPTFNSLNPRPAAPGAVGSSTLRVASYNVENYFLCPCPDPTGRGASNAAEFTRQRDKIVAALAGLNADVIGLIELEKAGGNAAAADLAAGLTAFLGGGANTYAAVADLATLVATDTEIKSGIIYRTSAVTTVGAPMTDTTAAAGAYSRDPLAQTFQQTSNSQKFIIVVNHFRSKSCPGTGGDADMGDGQACFNDRRRNQAQAVVNFINTTLAPIDPDVLVVGDLNSYGQEDPIDVLRAAGLSDVLNQYVALASQYSFTFNGETGRLDHAFATSSLNSQITGATIWHINADEPLVFDYNLESKPDDRYAATPYHASDHDPVLIGLNLTLTCPTISVSPTSVPTGTAGSAYGPVNFSQTGSAATITWSVTSNNLPAGLTLNPSTGVLSGTPTVAAGVNVTIRATDANNCFGEVIVTLQISCPTIAISPSTGATTTLTSGTVGQAYSQTFTAAPAGGGYTYSIPLAAIPAGLTFNTATGVLSGSPTTPGTFTFTVTASGFGGCTGSQAYSLTINCQTISITPAGPALPAGTAGASYSQQLTASNGTGTVNFTLMSGSFPTGITMSLAGLISGTPTVTGTFNVTIKATDANQCSNTQSYSLTINCPTITVTAPSTTTGTAGTAFSQTFTRSGGVGTITWSETGALPTGITLNSSTGALSGTPTQTGAFPITVKATDANGCFGTVGYTLTINCQTITVTAPATTTGAAGTAFSQTFTQSGGIGTITWSSTGTLPSGITLNSSTGVLGGTPTQTGTFPITVKATDANGCFGTVGYTLTINCQTVTVTAPATNTGIVGTPFSQTFTQSGGIGTTNFTTVSTLPAGITLSTAGALSGTPTQLGVFPITVTATDANGCFGTVGYTLTISCQTITVNAPATNTGATGLAFSQTFTQSGGIGTTTFSTASMLPMGLSLSAGGLLAGTPTQSGIFPITVKATDANGCMGAVSYTLTIDANAAPPLTTRIDDPLVCTGPGNVVSVTATVTNTNPTVQAAAFTATLTPTLRALPGSCTANVGACTVVNASTVTWAGTLAANQTVTINYQAQVNDGVLPGTQLCATSVATVGNSLPATVTACGTVNCPAVGPGTLPQANSPLSDQKAGSVLIFNIYTSSTNANQQNTRINLTNTNTNLSAFVHLFFVDGTSCSVADSILCLTPNQTTSFLASDLDPGSTGYIVAIAIDGNGCPTNFNYLIGDEYVKFATGHAANLGAEAIAAIAGGLPLCNNTSVTATLAFDGISYNVVPRVLALDNIPARADGNDTLLILNRIGGNLAIGASTLGTIFGLMYDDSESVLSFNVTGGCQLRNSVSSGFPRTTPRFEQFIPAGRSGWMRLFSQSDIGLTGAAINFNPNAAASAGAFNQGHNLHVLTNTSAANYIIPIFPPGC